MSKKPETKVRQKLYRLLANLSGVFFESIQQKSIRGTPDRIGCVKCPICPYARFVAIEFKATSKDKPTALQLHKILAIRKAGGVCMIVHRENIDEEVDKIKRLMQD